MGNKSCVLAIQTEQQIAIAGSSINGCIYVSVNEPDGISCQSLNLHFSGYEYAKIHYTSNHDDDDCHSYHHHHHHNTSDCNSYDRHTTGHYETHKEILIDQYYTIHSFTNGMIPQGHYEFPFQLRIPNHLPSSMHCNNGESLCEIRYDLQAFLRRSTAHSTVGAFFSNAFGGSLSMEKNYFSSKLQEIVLYKDPNGHDGNGHQNVLVQSDQPVFFPSKTQHVKYWCCINRGFMEVRAQLERQSSLCRDDVNQDPTPSNNRIVVNAYSGIPILKPNEPYQVVFRLVNQSTTSVKCVKMQLMEKVTWRAHIRTESRTNFPVDESIMGSSFTSTLTCHGETNHHEHAACSSHFLLPPVNPDTLDPNKFSFTIPSSSVRDSYQGRLIQVQHILRIKVITECCMTNPCTDMEIDIVRANTGAVDSSSWRMQGHTSSQEVEATVVEPSAPPFHVNHGEAIVADDSVTALPVDWSPQIAESIDLPVATVIGISNREESLTMVGMMGTSSETAARVSSLEDARNSHVNHANILPSVYAPFPPKNSC